jgi:ABC-type multidrug transport system fused ATPase/permease subunit
MQRIENFMKEEELLQKPDHNYSQLIGNSRFFVNAGFDPLETPKASLKVLSFNGLNHENREDDTPEKKEKRESPCRISFKNASFVWSNARTSTAPLHDISLELGDRPLVGVTGCPGSGKSALLLAILKELPLVYGHFSKTGRVVYVPQIPWVCAGTLRDNILFDAPYAEERYWRVIYACALDKDIGEFPNGKLKAYSAVKCDVISVKNDFWVHVISS